MIWSTCLSLARYWNKRASDGHFTPDYASCSVLIFSAFTCIIISGCAEDQEASARALYTQANESWRTAKNERSYQEVLLRFKEAKKLSTEIISSYPETSTAAGISSGELAIGGYTLDRLDGAGPTLLSLALAETSLLDAAALAVYSEKGPQASSVINVAERLVARGNYQSAKGMLENLLRGEETPTTFGASEIWGISWSTKDVESVLRIATLYYDMDEQQYGAKLLAYAKDLRDNIDRDWWKPGDGNKEDSIANAYRHFAKAYLHFGLRDQALQVTNVAFDHYADNRAYFELLGDSFAEVFLELGLQTGLSRPLIYMLKHIAIPNMVLRHGSRSMRG